MSLGERLRALRAMWPMLKRAVLSGQLFKPQCELTPPHPDILCEYNVKIPIADGIVLTANVFRSRKAQEEGRARPGRDVRPSLQQSAHPGARDDALRRGAHAISNHPAGRPAKVLDADQLGVAGPQLLGPGRLRGGQPQPPGLRDERRSAHRFLGPPGEELLRGDRMGCAAELVHWQGGAERRQLPRHQPVPCRGLSTLRRPAAVVAVHLPMGRAFRHVPRRWPARAESRTKGSARSGGRSK